MSFFMEILIRCVPDFQCKNEIIFFFRRPQWPMSTQSVWKQFRQQILCRIKGMNAVLWHFGFGLQWCWAEAKNAHTTRSQSSNINIRQQREKLLQPDENSTRKIREREREKPSVLENSASPRRKKWNCFFFLKESKRRKSFRFQLVLIKRCSLSWITIARSLSLYTRALSFSPSFAVRWNQSNKVLCVMTFSSRFVLFFVSFRFFLSCDCVKCEFIANAYVIWLNDWNEEKWSWHEGERRARVFAAFSCFELRRELQSRLVSENWERA